MSAAVVDDQIDDLLLGQTGVDAEAGERHVVPGLALVLQVVALAQPRVPEAHVSLPSTPSSISCGMRAFVLMTKGVSANRSAHSRAAFSSASGSGIAGVVEELLEIGQVVTAVRHRVDDDVLRIASGL